MNNNLNTNIPTAEQVLNPKNANVENVTQPVPPYHQSVQNENLPFKKTVKEEEIIFQHIEKPMVIKDHIHEIQQEQIQPIIHRERQQFEVKQITQPLKQIEIQPTKIVQSNNLEPEYRQTMLQKGGLIAENEHFSSSKMAEGIEQTFVLAPLVNEKIQRTVIEEITQVLHKDVIAPTVINETLPIHEKLVDAPIYHQYEISARKLDTIYGSEGSKIKDLNGILYSQYYSQPMWEKEILHESRPLYSHPQTSHQGSFSQSVVSQNRSDHLTRPILPK
eukprot:TRINITY_DN1330_c0_g1_i2.p1 TRINITY_DN1330_c0_g1~~TRINITY_DN1330_c0_g1_i2.p1  ORF type:complete len:276 (+),score=79.22 TRINITY_DN1330_c0_g1_i2:151-978(+)